MNYKKIKTWEDACKVNNVKPTALPEVSMLPKKFQGWLVAAYKLGVVAEAINTDEDGKIWTPDWSNWDQWKYFPWFEVKATKEQPSGVGFSDSHYGGWYSGTGVGSRLCFSSKEQVEHIQEHFSDLYKEFLLIIE